MSERRKRKRKNKPMNPKKYALLLNIKHRIHHILTMDSRNADIAEIT